MCKKEKRNAISITGNALSCILGSNKVCSTLGMSSAVRMLCTGVSLWSHSSLDLDHIYQINIADLNVSEVGEQGSQKALTFRNTISSSPVASQPIHEFQHQYSLKRTTIPSVVVLYELIKTKGVLQQMDFVFPLILKQSQIAAEFLLCLSIPIVCAYHVTWG